MRCPAQLRLLRVVAFIFLFCSATFAQDFALTHVNVFDGRSPALKQDMTILVKGNRILQVRPSASLKVPKGYKVLPMTGRYVIPGLWDMHVHLAGLSADPSWSGGVLLPMLIENGVLGVRDMGGDPVALERWKTEIQAGKRIGPHIIAAGKMIDGAFEDPSVITVHTAEESRRAVDQIASSNGDFVKVLSGVNKEEYFAVLDEASKKNLRVAGHLTPEVTVEKALTAGQHSFEHIIYSGIPLACTANEEQLDQEMSAAMSSGAIRRIGAVLDKSAEEYDPDRAQRLWQDFKAHGAAVVPTLVSTYVNAHMDELSQDDQALKPFPEKLRKDWAAAAIMPHYQADKLAWYKRELDREEKLVFSMFSASVRVLPGTDSLDPYNLPGSSLHKELELFVEAGFTPAQALIVATSDAAAFAGATDRGVLAAGRIADFLVLAENPLENIKNTRKISLIVLSGKAINIDKDGHLMTGTPAR
jgi:imidazolonepropionase-like amidohydrolase